MIAESTKIEITMIAQQSMITSFVASFFSVERHHNIIFKNVRRKMY